MKEPERFEFLGRSRPGAGSRVIGTPGSENYGGRRGVVLRRHERYVAMVMVRWDDDPDFDDAVVVSLLEDEPVLDQLSRIE